MDRLRVVFVASTLVVSGLVAPSASQASTPASPSPQGNSQPQILVLTDNLKEAFGTRDVRDHADMRVFCNRVKKYAPEVPDVLLLQEVRTSSATWVARRLGKLEGTSYKLLVAPGDDPVRRKAHGVVKRETAIVINEATMTPRGPHGFIHTKTGRRVSATGRTEIKNNAFAAASPVGTNFVMPFVSLHLGTNSSMKSTDAERTRTRWMKHIWKRMAALFGDTAENHFTFGGDFNTSGLGRYANYLYFHKRMKEVGFRIKPPHVGGVFEYIFTKTGLVTGDRDKSYSDVGHPRSPGFYSDHEFRWGELDLDDTSPTIPPNFRVRKDSNGRLQLSWNASTDPDDGVLAYWITIWEVRRGHWGYFGNHITSDMSLTYGNSRGRYEFTIRALDTSYNLSRGAVRRWPAK